MRKKYAEQQLKNLGFASLGKWKSKVIDYPAPSNCIQSRKKLASIIRKKFPKQNRPSLDDELSLLPYNRSILKRAFHSFLFVLLLSLAANAQSPARSVRQLFLVVPFENRSNAPGLDWIGEAFSEVLSQRMASVQLSPISRDERVYAFDRLGLPTNARISRATLLRIADEMDLDYVVTGSYTFDGRTFTVRAQAVELRRLRLLPEITETGALTQLADIQSGTAWSLLRSIDNAYPIAKTTFTNQAPPVRLDALESYIRGVISSSRTEKLKNFRNAVRLNPEYAEALLQLGKAYFEGKEYESASQAFLKVPKTSPLSNEASFYLGLASYYTGNLERAETAFHSLAQKMPLIEVFNNLGVVTARRGKPNSIEYIQRAAQADAGDADYRFNYAVALYRRGDNQAAARQLREALAIRPNDSEAKSLLEQINAGTPYPTLTSTGTASASGRAPLERIKRNYDETSYRQLLMEIENAKEMRYASMSRMEHVSSHVNRGNELLMQGLADQAEREFREAVVLDPTSASAHLGLARLLEQRNDLAAARMEAVAAYQLNPSADALLTLARIEVKQNNLPMARDYAERALRMEPNNSEAQELRRTILQKSGS